jgi:hypothetical protein
MALVQTALEAQLRRLLDQNDPSFIGFPSTTAQSASNWATALDAFWTSATDAVGNTLLTTNKPGLESAISSIQDPGTASSAATAFANGFTAYFSGMTLSITNLPLSGVGGNGIFSVVTTNIVTAVNQTALYNTLLAEFQILSSNVSLKITNLANAFYTGSLGSITAVATGLDTTPPGSGGPLPIVFTGFLQ